MIQLAQYKRMVMGMFVVAALLVQGVGLAQISRHSPQEQVDHVIWKNIPITVVLPVGSERRIDFPVPVKIEWPDAIGSKTRHLQLRENGSVYWTAAEPFSKHRVNVISMATGDSWLLDVEAREGASARTLVILDDRYADPASDATAVPAETAHNRHDGVDLVRFAAQHLYAPSRLVKPLAGVVRVPVATDEVPLYRGGELRTAPIMQWKSTALPPLYVTAVRVMSASTHTVTLDPRNLRGEWLSATAQHGWVSPAAEGADTTVWYLLSSRPFEESLP